MISFFISTIYIYTDIYIDMIYLSVSSSLSVVWVAVMRAWCIPTYQFEILFLSSVCNSWRDARPRHDEYGGGSPMYCIRCSSKAGQSTCGCHGWSPWLWINSGWCLVDSRYSWYSIFGRARKPPQGSWVYPLTCFEWEAHVPTCHLIDVSMLQLTGCVMGIINGVKGQHV